MAKMTFNRHLHNILGGLKRRGMTKPELVKVKAWMVSTWRYGVYRLCTWCDSRVTASTFSLDHMVPVVLGGPHTKNNLCLSCDKCNREKAGLDPEDWKKLKKVMATMTDGGRRNVSARLRAAGKYYRR
jgi:HNH endonuclease